MDCTKVIRGCDAEEPNAEKGKEKIVQNKEKKEQAVCTQNVFPCTQNVFPFPL